MISLSKLKSLCPNLIISQNSGHSRQAPVTGAVGAAMFFVFARVFHFVNNCISFYCFFNIFPDRIKDRIIIISVIDNLIKGAAGQAIQNMNLKYNFKEDEGLNFNPIFP